MVHGPRSNTSQNQSKTMVWDSGNVPDRCGRPVRSGRPSFIMICFFSTHFVSTTLNMSDYRAYMDYVFLSLTIEHTWTMCF